MFLLISLHFCRKGQTTHSATMCDLVLLGLVALSLTKSPMATAVPKKEWEGNGSTKNLKEIMIGRCFDYLENVNPSAGMKNCAEIWEEFLKVFNGKDPCSIKEQDYKKYLSFAEHAIPVNQSIFWSQTKAITFMFSHVTDTFMPLEDTLTGYLVDGLNWCGSRNIKGPNFESCPKWNDCENNAARSFWRAASKIYASKAQGVVTVMLNGSSTADTFRDNSIFAEIEVGNLDRKKVTLVRLWIIDNLMGPDNESCGRGSVAELEMILKEKTIQYVCEDNYRPVQILQCVNNADTPTCNLDGTP
ncbi:ADP-ribosyl cyclase/cyclic ADP-ribose hydrolase 2-like [Rhinoraja longicauda]